MSPEMSRIVRNTPLFEQHGWYLVRAKFGMGVPVLSVERADDPHRAVHLCVYTAMARITISPSIVLKPGDELWETVLGLFENLGEYDATTHQIVFEDEHALLDALDYFLDQLNIQ